METFAYLHAAVAYEAPESGEPDFEVGNPVWLQSLSWHKVSAQTATSLLAIACSLSIVGAAGNALALQRNDSGSAVVTLQNDLSRAGYYNGHVTGFYGEATEAAILRFQQEHGLTPDGVAGPKTLEVLQSKTAQTRSQHSNKATADVVLHRGAQGPAVVELQNQLRGIGYFDGPVTGFFGQLTEAAVMRFQEEKQIPADGKVGARTLTMLRQASPAKPQTLSQATPQALLVADHGSSPPPLSPTVDVLNRGDRGDAVAELQNRLRNLGYFDGPMTGFYGQLTEDAVSKFQQSKGLVVDGKAGPKTLSALTEVPTAQPTAAFAQGGPASPVPEILQRGDRGTEVTNLQNRLKELGYFDGPVTGFFGRLTEDAVFRFQREKGLFVDGKVGPKTVAVLEKAIPPASGTSAQTGSTSSSTTTVLGRGDRGLQVADLQNRLRSAGYFEGPMTGFYGQLTEDAVSKFQQDKGLTVDGKVGPKTLAAIQQLPRSQSQPSSQSSSSMNAVETSATRSTDSAPAASPKPQASASGSSGASALRSSPAAQPSSPQPSASRPAPQAVGFNAPAQPESSSTEPAQAVVSPDASPSPTANQGLKLGDSGVEVAKLQAALKQAGYLKGQVTGFFGKLTEDALIKFQQAQGLPADGVAGPQTQEALRRVIASGVTTNGRESGG